MLYDYEVRRSPFTATFMEGLSPKPHIHQHLELIYLTEGSSVATIDGQDCLLQAGQLVLVFPGQIHFYNDIDKIRGKMFIVHPEIFYDLTAYFSQNVPLHPVFSRDQLPEDIDEQLHRIFTLINSSNEFENIAAKGLMTGVISLLLRNTLIRPAEKDRDIMRDILQYCMGHYTEQISLDDLAEQMHLSKYYLSHIFKKRLNLSFPDFLNGLRVEHACRILHAERSVTDVAYAAGFNSIRSFNRNFQKHTGFTPTEFITVFKK